MHEGPSTIESQIEEGSQSESTLDPKIKDRVVSLVDGRVFSELSEKLAQYPELAEDPDVVSAFAEKVAGDIRQSNFGIIDRYKEHTLLVSNITSNPLVQGAAMARYEKLKLTKSYASSARDIGDLLERFPNLSSV